MDKMNELNVVNKIAEAVNGRIETVGVLPDESGFAVLSMPLPKNHWLTKPGYNVPPMPLRLGTTETMTISIGEDRAYGGLTRRALAEMVKEAAKYAVRASTMNGAEDDFDPDAMVGNFVVGLLGYWTENGLSGDAFDNPKDLQ